MSLQRCLTLSMQMFLLKPIRIIQMLKVKHMCKRSRDLGFIRYIALWYLGVTLISKVRICCLKYWYIYSRSHRNVVSIHICIYMLWTHITPPLHTVRQWVKSYYYWNQRLNSHCLVPTFTYKLVPYTVSIKCAERQRTSLISL